VELAIALGELWFFGLARGGRLFDDIVVEGYNILAFYAFLGLWT